MTRCARHRRLYAHRMRRWSDSPHTYQKRLRDAAFGGHTCYPFYVTVRNEEGA